VKTLNTSTSRLTFVINYCTPMLKSVLKYESAYHIRVYMRLDEKVRFFIWLFTTYTSICVIMTILLFFL